MYYIGLDVHKKTISYCVKDASGQIHEAGKIGATRHFKRLAVRRGRKCAIIAVAHTKLVIGYHLQRTRCAYTKLGSNYFDRLHAEGLKRHLVSA